MDALTIPRAALRSAIAFALPPRCPGCGAVTDDDHRFCLACWSALDFLGDEGCPSCGAPSLPAAAGLVCGACLADPPPFDRVRAAVAYGDIARAVALKLKHGRRIGLGETIARIMARMEALPEGALVTAVPLHRWRIWRRGFNQAAVIGWALARHAGRDFDPHLIERRRATPMLRGLTRTERAKAVRGAFAVPKAQRARIAGRVIVLVDDVFTTGGTARACAAVLKRAGAREVHVLCWARVILDD